VNRNLTLVIDQDLLLAARKVALDRRTSVNAMVRDFLAGVTTQSKSRAKARARLEKFFEARPVRPGKITWTREDLYDRKA
jgi:hypothetical protein